MSANSKHRDRQFFIARGVFGLAGAILVALVVFIAVRAGGTASAGESPTIVQPSADLQAAESTTVPLPPESAPGTTAPSVSPSAPASASPSPSKSVSASPSKSSVSPKPSKSSASPKPSVTKTTPPPPPVDELSANCSTNSWNNGFITTVRVTNKGSQAHRFTVTVSYSSSAKVVSGPWSNARTTNGNGGALSFEGNAPLAAGSSTMFGFQGSGTNNVKQSGCSVAVVGG
ncbi:cellulose binding domain-containing protein [Actinoplanes cyaneus]|uniref:cellulose binding domain-containing protein n=1 Tax=Actinoplanes cyaneus TaxID=52696 RepID=UPI001943457D|nr:cellulose binding domain-containing protein [Actinoplanes cyaneus]MCW2136536.1 Cellulose binding domain-containing protein [Actinoplanes cyaneus]